MNKKNARYFLTALMLFTFNTAIHAETVASTSYNSSTYAQTKYPIVMVPGAFAFDNILGIVDYWFGITKELRKQGAEVYVVNISGAALHEKRGEELLRDVENILAITGVEKVNLIAHSQGATAARYVAAIHPEWIASISCAHCMNEGTHFADEFGDLLGDGITEAAFGFFISPFNNLLELFSWVSSDGDYNSDLNRRQSALDLIEASSRKTYDVFNAQYPEAMPSIDCSIINDGVDGAISGGASVVNNVRYYSWGGTKPNTVFYDPIDAILINATKLFMPKDVVWDGLVPGCGHALGEFLRADYPANHYDAIGQTFGITPRGLNIPSIYVQQVNRLKNVGL